MLARQAQANQVVLGHQEQLIVVVRLCMCDAQVGINVCVFVHTS